MWALQVLSGLDTAGAQAALGAPCCNTDPGDRGGLGFLGLQADEAQAELDFLGMLWLMGLASGCDSAGAGLLLVLPRSRS